MGNPTSQLPLRVMQASLNQTAFHFPRNVSNIEFDLGNLYVRVKDNGMAAVFEPVSPQYQAFAGQRLRVPIPAS